MLQERIDMYTEAKECARAKGDSSKARRMDRGLKVGSLYVGPVHPVIFKHT